jgi:hypothetical protein
MSAGFQLPDTRRYEDRHTSIRLTNHKNSVMAHFGGLNALDPIQLHDCFAHVLLLVLLGSFQLFRFLELFRWPILRAADSYCVLMRYLRDGPIIKLNNRYFSE